MPLGPEFTHCKRCRRQAPPQESAEFLDWESDENGLPICPGCLTGLEEQEMAEDLMLPAPGLDGTYSGSCIVCLQGCDTGLAFVGEAEWAMVGLATLGVPNDQAQTMVVEQLAKQYGITAPGVVPDGEVTVGVSVCQTCVDKSGHGLPLGLTATGEVPGIRRRA